MRQGGCAYAGRSVCGSRSARPPRRPACLPAVMWDSIQPTDEWVQAQLPPLLRGPLARLMAGQGAEGVPHADYEALTQVGGGGGGCVCVEGQGQGSLERPMPQLPALSARSPLAIGPAGPHVLRGGRVPGGGRALCGVCQCAGRGAAAHLCHPPAGGQTVRAGAGHGCAWVCVVWRWVAECGGLRTTGQQHLHLPAQRHLPAHLPAPPPRRRPQPDQQGFAGRCAGVCGAGAIGGHGWQRAPAHLQAAARWAAARRAWMTAAAGRHGRGASVHRVWVGSHPAALQHPAPPTWPACRPAQAPGARHAVQCHAAQRGGAAHQQPQLRQPLRRQVRLAQQRQGHVIRRGLGAVLLAAHAPPHPPPAPPPPLPAPAAWRWASCSWALAR